MLWLSVFCIPPQEQADNKSAKAAMQEEQVGLLRDYITHQKLQHTMARNLLLADALSSDLETPSGMG
jgi:hypothetical protein